MSFSQREYEAAARTYRENWEATDAILYGMCRQYPDHRTRTGVNAKLLIIGRSYASGIERQIRSDRRQSSSINQLADHFWKNRMKVDAVLLELRDVREPLNIEHLCRILSAHGRLLRLVEKVARPDRTPRSFVSKYLHFHCPAVPIIDSFSVVGLKRLYPRMSNLTVLAGTGDEHYRRFLRVFWLLYEDAQASGAKITVKQLDRCLLAAAQEGR